MLRDPAGLPFHHVRFSNHVEQRGLAVVNMPHDGHNRRARFQLLRLVFRVDFDLLDRGMNLPLALGAFFNLEPKTIFRTNLLRDAFIDRLIDVSKHSKLHQICDYFEWLLPELFGQIAHDDRRLDCYYLGVGR